MKADPRTKEEILAVLNEFDRVSREQDLAGVMRIFVHDGAIFIGSESGAEAKGIEQIRSFFEELFSGPIAYGFCWQEIDIHVVGDMAWLFTDCQIETISAAGHHKHPYRVTAIFQRVEGLWRWIHYHGSEPVG